MSTGLVTAEVTGTARASLQSAWSVFVPIDLSALFQGKGPLPAVTRVSDQTGPWDVIGHTRKVTLSDGSTIGEEITAVQAPQDGAASFGYTVSGYAGLIGKLTGKADGFWIFDETGSGTQIKWTYAFHPKSAVTRPILFLIVNFLWRGYMADALRKTIALIERGNELEEDQHK